MTAIMKASMISKKYIPGSATMELAPCSLVLEKGMIYVIKGKSGSGKSTLLNLLGGIDKPSSGSVFFQGNSFYELSDKEQSKIRNENFGFIFQSFNLIPELTVQENIELPKYFNRSCDINPSRIASIAHEIGIGSLLRRKPHQLSGGEQQRVAIARALITNPDIIFADEPTGNLDTANSRIIADLLAGIVASRKATLVLVTHEERLIEHEHINLIIHNGQLKAEEQHGLFGT